MRNKIHKILGVGMTLVIAMALVIGFAAPVAANPGETINEWYEFSYPVEGADGDWFYDPSILADGKITEAIDGTLYVHVQRCVPDLAFDNANGTVTFSQFGTSQTGTITADIDGDWVVDLNSNGYADAGEPDGPDTDFVAFLLTAGAVTGSACVRGTITATNLSFQGSIETITGGSFPTPPYTYNVTEGGFTVGDCGFNIDGPYGDFGLLRLDDMYDINFEGFTDIGASLFKSGDGGRTWEETNYPGGWVVDMAASSIDADTLYVTDGHYVYKTDDAGDTWGLLAQDSLETALAGYCGIPPCCMECGDGCCPACPDEFAMSFSCPITSIDVTYNADDNPFVFIGTRQHSNGVDLVPPGGDGNFDCFPGDVLYIGEAGYPANWTSLNLPCFHGGGYDALAVGCAPDWADSHETYVVVSNGSDTGVIYTKGTICGWYEFAELLWDCTEHFGSLFASRIAFPDDWEDTGTLFVGVVDCDYCGLGGDGGDVYMAMDGSCLDMNVKGISTGCQGKEAVDIFSLDVKGDTDEASLIAGAFCCPEVYYSTDGGWSWDESEKDPTGGGGPGAHATPFTLTSVIWYEDTALAATIGTECAVSMSCGEEVGQYWNQISLISTGIDSVLYIDHSPGYVCGDSETMFMLTYWDIPGEFDGHVCFDCQEQCYDDTQSLFRYDGTYWERVFANFIAGSDTSPYQIQRVRVSPDFNTTNCVYVTNSNFEMWRTTDAGCSWDKLTFPCAPRDTITAAIVIDEDTVITGGYGIGTPAVFKTTRHGARPWDEYELPEGAGLPNFFALEPGYEDPGSVLLGDNKSQVYISEDGGETWDLVGKALFNPTEHPTWVIFDPSYATNHIIYAAASYRIARCIIDPDEDWADQEWEVLCDNLGEAAGIAAAGDTALYVADAQEVGGMHIPIYCGVFRSLNPDAEDPDDVVFEELYEGLIEGSFPSGQGTELRHLWLTCDTSDEGCAENVLWSLEQYGAYPENIWVYEDTLAAPVVLAMPINEQKLGTTDSATLSWNALCGADCYEVSLWKYCAECPDEKLVVTLEMDCAPGECMVCGPTAAVGDCACEPGDCPCTSDTCIVVDGLASGTEYYWQVRVCLCKPFLSKWSEERTFMTALVPIVDLCSPACGGQNIILTPNFSWDEVDGATGYDIELATTETFTAGVVRGSSTVNAWVAPEDLEYATTYYWRVRAEKDGVLSDWTVCIFTTMGRPEAPPPPVTVEQTPPPQITVEVPVEQIAPNWIYAIIGIGAALVVVVIVLTVRTRRPPA